MKEILRLYDTLKMAELRHFLPKIVSAGRAGKP
jgi:hypothetical protein